MRITRLVLDRYGHLSDLALAFPPEPACMSCWGQTRPANRRPSPRSPTPCSASRTSRPTPSSTPTRDLRVAIGLRGEDGRERMFVRIKRNQNDLLDADGQPVAESALAGLLGGVSRERFGRVFGLDAAALRAGGQAILAGRGDLGESILQAHTGLTGLRALADRLGEEAGRLFGTKHGKRAFHVAVDAHKAAREQLEARIVPPAAFARARADHDRLVAERDAAAAERSGLETERSRLARIDATAPARAALARDLPELAALGDVPALPADAEAQMRDARDAQRARRARPAARTGRRGRVARRSCGAGDRRRRCWRRLTRSTRSPPTATASRPPSATARPSAPWRRRPRGRCGRRRSASAAPTTRTPCSPASPTRSPATRWRAPPAPTTSSPRAARTPRQPPTPPPAP